jgi:hypothetical protein
MDSNGDETITRPEEDAFAGRVPDRIRQLGIMLPFVPRLHSEIEDVNRTYIEQIFGVAVADQRIGIGYNRRYVKFLFGIVGGWLKNAVGDGDEISELDITAFNNDYVSEKIRIFNLDLEWAIEVFNVWIMGELPEGVDDPNVTIERIREAIAEFFGGHDRNIIFPEVDEDGHRHLDISNPDLEEAGSVLFSIADSMRLGCDVWRRELAERRRLEREQAEDDGVHREPLDEDDVDAIDYKDNWFEDLWQVYEIYRAPMVDGFSPMDFYHRLLGMPTREQLNAMPDGEERDTIMSNVISFLFSIANQQIGTDPDGRPIRGAFDTVEEYIAALTSADQLYRNQAFQNIFTMGQEERIPIDWDRPVDPNDPFGFMTTYMKESEEGQNAKRFISLLMGFFNDEYGWIGEGFVNAEMANGDEDVPKFRTVEDYIFALEIIYSFMNNPDYRTVFNGDRSLEAFQRITWYRNNGDPDPSGPGEEGENQDEIRSYRDVMSELFGNVLMLFGQEYVTSGPGAYSGRLTPYAGPLRDRAAYFLSTVVHNAARMVKSSDFRRLLGDERFDTSIEESNMVHRRQLLAVVFYFASKIGIGDGMLYERVEDLLALCSVGAGIREALIQYVIATTEGEEFDIDLSGSDTFNEGRFRAFSMRLLDRPEVQITGGNIEIILRNAQAIRDLRESRVTLQPANRERGLGNDLMIGYNGSFRDIEHRDDQYSFANEIISVRPGTDEVVSRTVSWVEGEGDRRVVRAQTFYYLDGRAVYNERAQQWLNLHGSVGSNRDYLSPIFVNVEGIPYMSVIRTYDADGHIQSEEAIRMRYDDGEQIQDDLRLNDWGWMRQQDRDMTWDRELVTRTVYGNEDGTHMNQDIEGGVSRTYDAGGHLISSGRIEEVGRMDIRRVEIRDGQTIVVNETVSAKRERVVFYVYDAERGRLVDRVEDRIIETETGRVRRIDIRRTEGEQPYRRIENIDFVAGRRDLVLTSRTYGLSPITGQLEENIFREESLNLDGNIHGSEDLRRPALAEGRLMYDYSEVQVDENDVSTETTRGEQWNLRGEIHRNFFGAELRRLQHVTHRRSAGDRIGDIIADTQGYTAETAPGYLPGFNIGTQMRRYVILQGGARYDIEDIDLSPLGHLINIDEDGNRIIYVREFLGDRRELGERAATGRTWERRYNYLGQPVLEIRENGRVRIENTFIGESDIASLSVTRALDLQGNLHEVERTEVPRDAMDPSTGLPRLMPVEFIYNGITYQENVYRMQRTDFATGYRWIEYRNAEGNAVISVDESAREVTIAMDFAIGTAFSGRGVIVALSGGAWQDNPQLLSADLNENVLKTIELLGTDTATGLPRLEEYDMTDPDTGEIVYDGERTFRVRVTSQFLGGTQWEERYNLFGRKLETNWYDYNLIYRFWHFNPGSRLALDSVSYSTDAQGRVVGRYITRGRIERDTAGVPLLGRFSRGQTEQILFRGIFTDGYGNDTGSLLNIRGQTIIEVRRDRVIHNTSFVAGTEIVAESETFIRDGVNVEADNDRTNVVIREGAVATFRTTTDLTRPLAEGNPSLQGYLNGIGLTPATESGRQKEAGRREGDYIVRGQGEDTVVFVTETGLRNILGPNFDAFLDAHTADVESGSIYVVLAHHPVSGKDYLQFFNSRGQMVLKVVAPIVGGNPTGDIRVTMYDDYVPGTRVATESRTFARISGVFRELESSSDAVRERISVPVYDAEGNSTGRSETIDAVRITRREAITGNEWIEYYDADGRMVQKIDDQTITYCLDFFAGDQDIPIRTVVVDRESGRVVTVRQTRWAVDTPHRAVVRGEIALWEGRLATMDYNGQSVTITDVDNIITHRSEEQYFNYLDQIVLVRRGYVWMSNTEFLYGLTTIPTVTEVYRGGRDGEAIEEVVRSGLHLKTTEMRFNADGTPVMADFTEGGRTERVFVKDVTDHRWGRRWEERYNYYGQSRERIEDLTLTDSEGRTHSFHLDTMNYRFIGGTEVSRESFVDVNGIRTQRVELLEWPSGEYFDIESRYRLQYTDLQNHLIWQEVWQIEDDADYLRERYDGYIENGRFIDETRTTFNYDEPTLNEFEKPLASSWETRFVESDELISFGRRNPWEDGSYVDAQGRTFIQETNIIDRVTQQMVRNMLGNDEIVYDGELYNDRGEIIYPGEGDRDYALNPDNFRRQTITVRNLDDVAGYLGIAREARTYLYDQTRPRGEGELLITTTLLGNPHYGFTDAAGNIMVQEENHVTQVVTRNVIDNKGRNVRQYDGYIAQRTVILNGRTYQAGDFVYRKVTEFTYDHNREGILGIAVSGATYIVVWDPVTGRELRGEQISRSTLVRFPDTGEIINAHGGTLIQIEDLTRPGLVWQEEKDNRGATLIKYDGYITDRDFRVNEISYHAGDFIRMTETRNIYTEGRFNVREVTINGRSIRIPEFVQASIPSHPEFVYRLLRIAPATVTYIYDSHYINPGDPNDHRRPVSISSLDVSFNSGGVFAFIDADGKVRVSLHDLLRDLEWQETRDNRGRVTIKMEIRADGSQRETDFEYDDSPGRYGIYDVAWIARTWVTDNGQRELFTESVIQNFDHVSSPGRSHTGQISYYITNHILRSNRIEVKDSRGRLYQTYKGYEDTDGNFIRERLIQNNYDNGILGFLFVPYQTQTWITDERGAQEMDLMSESAPTVETLIQFDGSDVDPNNVDISQVIDFEGRLTFRVNNTYRIGNVSQAFEHREVWDKYGRPVEFHYWRPNVIRGEVFERTVLDYSSGDLVKYDVADHGHGYEYTGERLEGLTSERRQTLYTDTGNWRAVWYSNSVYLDRATGAVVFNVRNLITGGVWKDIMDNNGVVRYRFIGRVAEADEERAGVEMVVFPAANGQAERTLPIIWDTLAELHYPRGGTGLDRISRYGRPFSSTAYQVTDPTGIFELDPSGSGHFRTLQEEGNLPAVLQYSNGELTLTERSGVDRSQNIGTTIFTGVDSEGFHFDRIEPQELSLREDVYWENGVYNYQRYESQGASRPQEVRLYYDARQLPDYIMMARDETGIVQDPPRPYTVLASIQVPDSPGTYIVLEFPAERTLQEHFGQLVNAGEEFSIEGMPYRVYRHGVLEGIYEPYRVERRGNDRSAVADRLFRNSPAAHVVLAMAENLGFRTQRSEQDREIREQAVSIMRDVDAKREALRLQCPVPRTVVSDGVQEVGRRVHVVGGGLLEEVRGWFRGLFSGNRLHDLSPVIFILLGLGVISVVGIILFAIGWLVYKGIKMAILHKKKKDSKESRMISEKEAERIVGYDSYLSVGNIEYVDVYPESYKNAIMQLFKELKFTEDDFINIARKIRKNIDDEILPPIKDEMLAHEVYVACIREAYTPVLEKYFEDLGLTGEWAGSDVSYIDPLYRRFDPVTLARQAVTIKDQVIDNIMAKLVARNINQYEPWKSEQLVNPPDTLKIKAERARSDFEKGNPSNFIDSYTGWVHIPLYQEFIATFFTFLSGSLGENSAYMRHIFELANTIPPTEMVHAVAERTGFWSVILHDQLWLRLNDKVQKGAGVWDAKRMLFEEPHFAALLGDKVLKNKDPLQSLNITVGFVKAQFKGSFYTWEEILEYMKAYKNAKGSNFIISDNVFHNLANESSIITYESLNAILYVLQVLEYVVPMELENAKKELSKGIPPARRKAIIEQQIPFLNELLVFQEKVCDYLKNDKLKDKINSRKNPDFRTIFIQRICDQKFLPPVIKAWKDEEKPVLTYPARFVNIWNVLLHVIPKWMPGRKIVEKLKRGRPGLIDYSLDLMAHPNFKGTRDKETGVYTGMSEKEWQKLSSKEKAKVIRGVRWFESHGRLNFKVLFGIPSVVMSLWLLSSKIAFINNLVTAGIGLLFTISPVWIIGASIASIILIGAWNWFITKIGWENLRITFFQDILATGALIVFGKAVLSFMAINIVPVVLSVLAPIGISSGIVTLIVQAFAGLVIFGAFLLMIPVINKTFPEIQLSYPMILNISMLALMYIFAFPALILEMGMMEQVASFLLLYGSVMHIPWILFSVLMIRATLYLGQWAVNKKTINPRKTFNAQYNMDVGLTMDALREELGLSQSTKRKSIPFALRMLLALDIMIPSVLAGIGFGLGAIVTVKAAIIFAAISSAVGLGLIILGVIVYYIWKWFRAREFKSEIHTENFRVRKDKDPKNRAKAVYFYAIDSLYKDNIISCEQWKQLREGDSNINLSTDEAWKRVKRILNRFYSAGVEDTNLQLWTEREKITLQVHGMTEPFMYSWNDITGLKKEEVDAGTKLGIRFTVLTELQSFIDTTYSDEWSFFVEKLVKDKWIIEKDKDSLVDGKFITTKDADDFINKLSIPETYAQYYNEEQHRKIIKDKIVHWYNMRASCGYKTIEGMKHYLEAYRLWLEYEFEDDGYINANVRDEYVLDSERRRELTLKVLANITDHGRRNILLDVYARTEWVPLYLLTPVERAMVLRACSDNEKSFLLYDEYYDKKAREKVQLSISLYPAAGDYITRPENAFFMDWGTLRTEPAFEESPIRQNRFEDGYQAFPPKSVLPAGAPPSMSAREQLAYWKAPWLGVMARYRNPLSLRHDAAQEVRPEEAVQLPKFMSSLSMPNVGTQLFGMYALNRNLSKVNQNFDLSESSWTQMVQNWMNWAGMVGEYGKFLTKEEFIRHYALIPMSRPAEDTPEAMAKQIYGIEARHSLEMQIAGSKGLTITTGLTPEKKYAGDYLDITHEVIATDFFMSEKTPLNWKYTHLVVSGSFYGLKPFVVLANIVFTILAVVFFLDPAHSLPMAIIFLVFSYVMRLSINFSSVYLLNKQYGSPWGILRFIWGWLVDPGFLWLFTFLIPHYYDYQKEKSRFGKFAFIPSNRSLPSIAQSWRYIYSENKPTILKGAVIFPLIFTFAGWHPAVFLIASMIYIFMIGGWVISPFHFKQRKGISDWWTHIAIPIIGVTATGIMGYFIANYLMIAMGIIWTVILLSSIGKGKFAGAKIREGSYTGLLIALFITTITGNVSNVPALLIMSSILLLINKNTRGWAFDVFIGGFVYAQIKGLIDALRLWFGMPSIETYYDSGTRKDKDDKVIPDSLKTVFWKEFLNILKGSGRVSGILLTTIFIGISGLLHLEIYMVILVTAILLAVQMGLILQGKYKPTRLGWFIIALMPTFVLWLGALNVFIILSPIFMYVILTLVFGIKDQLKVWEYRDKLDALLPNVYEEIKIKGIADAVGANEKDYNLVMEAMYAFINELRVVQEGNVTDPKTEQKVYNITYKVLPDMEKPSAQQFSNQQTSKLYPAEVTGAVVPKNTVRGNVTVSVKNGVVNIENIDSLNINPDEKAALIEVLTFAAGELMTEGQSKNINIMISSSTNKLILHHERAGTQTFEIHWAFLKSALSGSRETTEERMLFLKGAMWHDMYHFLYPELEEKAVEEKTIEYFKAHPEILDATIKVLDSDNPNWLYGEDWRNRLLEARKTDAVEILSELIDPEKTPQLLKEIMPNVPLEGDITDEKLRNILMEMLQTVQERPETAPAIMYLLGRQSLTDTIRSTGELMPINGGVLKIIDVSVLENVDIGSFMRTINTDNTKPVVVDLTGTHNDIIQIVRGLGIAVVENSELTGNVPEDIAMQNALRQYRGFRIASREVVTTIENATKWSYAETIRYIVCSKNLTNVALLSLYNALPNDVKEALRRADITAETITRATIQNTGLTTASYILQEYKDRQAVIEVAA